jgi:hypothetical protein
MVRSIPDGSRSSPLSSFSPLGRRILNPYLYILQYRTLQNYGPETIPDASIYHFLTNRNNFLPSLKANFMVWGSGGYTRENIAFTMDAMN